MCRDYKGKKENSADKQHDKNPKASTKNQYWK
jgi:hypothetical protein